MPVPIITGTSGIQTARSATNRRVVVRNPEYLPGGCIVQGSKWIDPDNTGDTDTIRAGHVGMLSSGKLVPALFGPVASDYTSGQTTLTVSVNTAIRIYQALGHSSTIYLLANTAAPTTLATVLATAVTISNVNTATGALTITDLGANRESDGSMLIAFQPVLLGGTGGLSGHSKQFAIIDEPWGLKVSDADGVALDVDLARAVVGGYVDTSQIPLWPSNAFVAEVLAHNLRQANTRLQFDNLV